MILVESEWRWLGWPKTPVSAKHLLVVISLDIRRRESSVPTFTVPLLRIENYWNLASSVYYIHVVHGACAKQLKSTRKHRQNAQTTRSANSFRKLDFGRISPLLYSWRRERVQCHIHVQLYGYIHTCTRPGILHTAVHVGLGIPGGTIFKQIQIKLTYSPPAKSEIRPEMIMFVGSLWPYMYSSLLKVGDASPGF